MTFSRRSFDYPGYTQDRQTGSLAGFAVALLVVVVGLYLVNTLRAAAALQDCVLSGRTGCEIAGP